VPRLADLIFSFTGDFEGSSQLSFIEAPVAGEFDLRIDPDLRFSIRSEYVHVHTSLFA